MRDGISDGWDLRAQTYELAPRRCHDAPADGTMPVTRGRNIAQHDHRAMSYDLWVDRRHAEDVSKGAVNEPQLVVRLMTGVLNERTLVAAVLPPGVAPNNSLQVLGGRVNPVDRLVLCALLNSTAADWEFRLTVTTTVSSYHLTQLHVPHPDERSQTYWELAKGAAALGCCGIEGFEELTRMARESRVPHDDVDTGYLRTRLDALAAHACGLTRLQYRKVLDAFPLIPPETKWACTRQYRDIEEGT